MLKPLQAEEAVDEIRNCSLAVAARKRSRRQYKQVTGKMRERGSSASLGCWMPALPHERLRNFDSNGERVGMGDVRRDSYGNTVLRDRH